MLKDLPLNHMLLLCNMDIRHSSREETVITLYCIKHLYYFTWLSNAFRGSRLISSSLFCGAVDGLETVETATAMFGGSIRCPISSVSGSVSVVTEQGGVSR